MRRFILGLAVFGVAATGEAQSNFGPRAGGIQILAYSPMGQSFRAESSQLLEIGFSFATFNPQFDKPSVTIRLLEGDGLDGPSIAEREFTPTETATFAGVFSFANFAGTFLNVGSMYTAAISTTNAYWGLDVSGDLYADGRSYLGRDVTFDADDLLFEVRSAATVVPEPSSLALLAPAALLLGAAARRRRSVA